MHQLPGAQGTPYWLLLYKGRRSALRGFRLRSAPLVSGPLAPARSAHLHTALAHSIGSRGPVS